MNDRPSRLLRIELVMLAVLGGTFFATPAMAHKLIVFGTAQGKTIAGSVYFYGGTPARDAKVTLVGPGGAVLDGTRTDAEGRFTFPVQFRCDHKLIADVGGGHQAEFTVPADELPDDLPAPGRPAHPPAEPPRKAEPAAPPKQDQQAPPAAPGQEVPATPQPQDLRAEVAAVGRQVAALRQDLDQYKNHLRYQDIVAGIGYILGIMGLVFYFLGVRRKPKSSATRES